MDIQSLVCSMFQLGATCQTMTQEKLLVEYLLVPSVIMIIFLYIATDSFLKGKQTGIKSLLAIVFYIVVVYSGYYGPFAMFVMSYVQLFLIGMFVIFVITRFISISDLLHLGRSARRFGEEKYDTKLIADRIKVKEDEIKRLKNRLDKADGDQQRSMLNALISEANMELELYKKQLERSKR
ncbi:MAG: hypothetical protein KAU95_00090 [Candidatus Aenigmarchaeota archaeon]|nr:hypothetical protein [Candidatus Aenigmarchaeota archaeon]